MNGKPPCCIWLQQGGALFVKYHVSFENTDVGEVSVSREGLYYTFSCRAVLQTGELYRLFLVSEQVRFDLGILVPDKDTFCCRKKLPAKYFSGDSFQFLIENNSYQEIKNGVVISQDQPFAHIEKLLESRLQIRHGKPEIVFADD